MVVKICKVLERSAIVLVLIRDGVGSVGVTTHLLRPGDRALGRTYEDWSKIKTDHIDMESR